MLHFYLDIPKQSDLNSHRQMIDICAIYYQHIKDLVDSNEYEMYINSI